MTHVAPVPGPGKLAWSPPSDAWAKAKAPGHAAQSAAMHKQQSLRIPACCTLQVIKAGMQPGEELFGRHLGTAQDALYLRKQEVLAGQSPEAIAGGSCYLCNMPRGVRASCRYRHVTSACQSDSAALATVPATRQAAKGKQVGER